MASAESAHPPDYWRGRADSVRGLLARTHDRKMRGYLLEIIAEYERLARIAESHGREPPSDPAEKR